MKQDKTTIYRRIRTGVGVSGATRWERQDVLVLAIGVASPIGSGSRSRARSEPESNLESEFVVLSWLWMWSVSAATWSVDAPSKSSVCVEVGDVCENDRSGKDAPSDHEAISNRSARGVEILSTRLVFEFWRPNSSESAGADTRGV